MKKHLMFISVILCVLPNIANGVVAETDYDLQYRKCKIHNGLEDLLVGTTYTYDISCYETGDFQSACYNCTSGSTTLNGVEVTTEKVVEVRIFGTKILCSCNSGVSTAVCAAGYYGTGFAPLIGSPSGCTACPDNATCAGGNGTTFLCNVGYFANGDVCEQCPSSGTTAAIGATVRGECFLPAGTVFSDNVGGGEYGADCYYSE